MSSETMPLADVLAKITPDLRVFLRPTLGADIGQTYFFPVAQLRSYGNWTPDKIAVNAAYLAHAANVLPELVEALEVITAVWAIHGAGDCHGEVARKARAARDAAQTVNSPRHERTPTDPRRPHSLAGAQP